ncbi:abortive infection family protein [Rhizobium sp. BG4]|uniref:abortive infection family protein n=1 Tax=Rhizobium sp. BG4 TaxID=2613770 RepID=UPI001FF013CD|nr:abortive infection family protein [Rhizobium sp. BG4]
MAAKELNLAPDQHTEEPIKQILGGAMTLVNGIGTLRNRLSDAHGRGGSLPVRPSPRHASLAVNTAGAVATFLVETLAAKRT